MSYPTYSDLELEIQNLEQENRNLREKLSEITMVSDDEKQSIEHILELEQENRRLSEKNKIYSNALVQEKEKNRKLSEGKIIYASEKEQRHYVDILEENKKLKEERDNCLKEVKLCYNDIHSLEGQISDLEEENKKLKAELEFYKKQYKHSMGEDS